MNVPDDLRYASSHEWLRADGTVGITDHAQAELTDVVFVDLPAVGKELKAGEVACVVESVKAASDIYAPVSGEVVEVLSQLAREGTTMAMATHDLRLASRIANNVVFIEAGSVVETGTAGLIFSNPQELRTQRFISTLKGEAGAEP